MSLRLGNNIIGGTPSTEEIQGLLINDSSVSEDTTYSSSKINETLSPLISTTSAGTTTYSSQSITDKLGGGWIAVQLKGVVTFRNTYTDNGTTLFMNRTMRCFFLKLVCRCSNAISANAQFTPIDISSAARTYCGAPFSGINGSNVYFGFLWHGDGGMYLNCNQNTAANSDIKAGGFWFY